MDKIKIYGERNTGTNYLSRLIVNNLNTTELRGTVPNSNFWQKSEFNKNLYFLFTFHRNLGWKHTFVNTSKLKLLHNTENICFITLTKNPYSFLLSLYKKPYHYKGILPKSFSDFLTTKWYVQKRDNIKANYYNNPIDLWNSKNTSYLDLKKNFDSQTLNIKYEDLLANPNEVIDKISSYFMLNKNQIFNNYTKSTKEDQKSFSYYQKYYIEEQWINELSDEEINIISQNLDPKIIKHYGYNIL